MAPETCSHGFTLSSYLSLETKKIKKNGQGGTLQKSKVATDQWSQKQAFYFIGNDKIGHVKIQKIISENWLHNL